MDESCQPVRFEPRSIAAAVLLLALLGSAAATNAQVPYLAEDLDATPIEVDTSYQEQVVSLGSFALFLAYDALHGEELWRTDGTPEGTFLVADILPGPGGSHPRRLMKAGDFVYFRAYDGVHGGELWRTDGTAEGTVLVKDLLPPGTVDDGGEPYPAAEIDGNLIFTAYVENGQFGLWRSDGTAAGTYLISDVLNPRDPVLFGGQLYFAAASPSAPTARRLWRTDGTPSGTQQALDVSSPKPLLAANGALFMAASVGHPSGYPGLWKTDGTAAGTVRLDAGLSSYASNPKEPVLVGGTLYFTCEYSLWAMLCRSDGTPAGTAYVWNPAAPKSANISHLTAGLGLVYFWGDVDSNNEGLWRSDGTEAGTWPLWVGPRGGGLARLQVAIGSSLYFVPDGSGEIWRTDGTTGGTQRIDGYLGRAGRLSVFADSLLFFNGFELWKHGHAGFERIRTFATGTNSAFVAPVAEFGGKVYFEAAVNQKRSLWRSAGEAEQLWEANGSCYERIGSKVATADRFFFSVYPDQDDCWGSPVVLWSDDGSPEGAAPFFTLPAAAPLTMSNLVAGNGGVYFAAGSYAGGARQLWVANGTPGGAALVKDFGPANPVDFFVSEGAYVNGALHFAVNDGTSGIEPWRSDGTPAGTRLVRDLVPGSGSSRPSSFSPLGNTILYFAVTSAGSPDLFRSDGTEAGTFALRTGCPTCTYSFDLGKNLGSAGGVGYFYASGYHHYGASLWKTDGTPAGTALVTELSAATQGVEDSSVLAVGNVLLFATGTGELWRSDGTAAGTYSLGVQGAALGVARSVAFFKSGQAILRSDGTLAGTWIVPGSLSLDVRDALRSSSRFYFSANDQVHGFELWAMAWAADAGVTVTNNHSMLSQGQATTYTTRVTNGGPDTAPFVTVSSAFPSALTCWTRCSPDAGATCSVRRIDGPFSDTVHIPPRQSVTYTSTCRVSPTASGSIAYTVSLTPPNGLADAGVLPNVASDVDLVVPAADLAVTLSGPPHGVQPGQMLEYSASVANLGPNDATEVSLFVELSPFLSLVSATPDAPACVSSSGRVTCALGAVPQGTARGVQLATIVRPDTPPSVVVSSAITSAAQWDPEEANNIDTQATPVAATEQQFYTLIPCRAADTRVSTGPLGARVAHDFAMGGICGVADDATAVALNVTVTQPSVGGYITVYPSGMSVPMVSTVNFVAGQTRANNVHVPLGLGGQVRVVSGQPSGTVQVIIDVVGYYR